MSTNLEDRDKLCWFCKQFYFSAGKSGYSEYTPGSDMSMGCHKSIWYIGIDSFAGPAELGAFINLAKDCPHFEPDDYVVNHIKTRSDELQGKLANPRCRKPLRPKG